MCYISYDSTANFTRNKQFGCLMQIYSCIDIIDAVRYYKLWLYWILMNQVVLLILRQNRFLFGFVIYTLFKPWIALIAKAISTMTMTVNSATITVDAVTAKSSVRTDSCGVASVVQGVGPVPQPVVVMTGIGHSQQHGEHENCLQKRKNLVNRIYSDCMVFHQSYDNLHFQLTIKAFILRL